MRLAMRRVTKRWILCCLAALLPSIAGAADLAPNGALARWLDTEAGPELAATLARHPRVAGEAVAFAAVVEERAGYTDTAGSRPRRLAEPVQIDERGSGLETGHARVDRG